MKIWTGFLALCALVLVCTAPVGAPVAAGDSGHRHFFWKVTGPKGTVYLLGTIHVGRPDFYPLAPVIEKSFEGADTLITEAPLDDSNASPARLKMLMQKGTYPVGDSLEKHISRETHLELARYLASNKELATSYTRLKPWFLSLAIALSEVKRMGFNAEKGLDKHFMDKAAAMHKPVGALETSEAQLELMSSFSEELQDQLLLSALLDAERNSDMMDRMLRAWKSGDAEAMEQAKVCALREHPRLKPVFERLFDKRNDAMAQQVERFLDLPKTFFVAVGAGHLVGEHGILSQLRGKHYAVEQL